MYKNLKKFRNNKIMVIGSGPVVVGQAAEFDYAGTQACSSLKELGYEVVLVNSNPATIMTDKAIANKVYMEPLNLDTLQKIIKIEKPSGLLSAMGGQNGLTFSMQLEEMGFLKEHDVELLGAKYETIKKSEDRLLFSKTMVKIGQPIIESIVSNNDNEILNFVNKIGFPIIIRPAFTMGGSGGGVANNQEELINIIQTGKKVSPINQVLIEKSVYGFKEIEFEIIRDASGTSVCICCMENFDPVGIHTGDSMVVAPSVSLSADVENMLKQASIDIVSELKIEGACNCQFALNPKNSEYFVIEVNPRVSRSSALASKATGYPIAKVAAKIALGCSLDEIKNDLVPTLMAKHEPEIDYFVMKVPKWANNKFYKSSCKIGVQMKATGESMALGMTFEEALLKSIRGVYGDVNWMYIEKFEKLSNEDLKKILRSITNESLFAIFELIKRDLNLEEIYDVCKVDYWFLNKLKNLDVINQELKQNLLTDGLYQKAKINGYSDVLIEKISGKIITCEKFLPKYKIVDTCAGKYKSKQKYFFSTYAEIKENIIIDNNKNKIIVLGSGPITIGQGIEFDYACVQAVLAYKKLGYEVIMINNNPETVSTDYDIADRLYFEPLTIEDVMNVINVEKPMGVVVAFGGQTTLNLVKSLEKNKINIIGTSPNSIEIAEDRKKFNEFADKLKINIPEGFSVKPNKILETANKLGYPVVLRPSYIIGGSSVIIAYNKEDIACYLNDNCRNNEEILIDKYLPGEELEVDAICDGESIFIPGIIQHIEKAGVHSGDSICVCPHYNLSDEIVNEIIAITKKISIKLGIMGLINIQFVIFGNKVYVLEVNPRSSRSVPIVSKILGVSLVEIAIKVMNGCKLIELGIKSEIYQNNDCYGVKVPIFSFEKFEEMNINLDASMKSTGEVLGIDMTFEKAAYKALSAANYKLKKSGKILVDTSNITDLELEKIVNDYGELGFETYLFSENNFEEAKKLIEQDQIAYLISFTNLKYGENKILHEIRRIAIFKKIDLIFSIELSELIIGILKSDLCYENLNTKPMKFDFVF